MEDMSTRFSHPCMCDPLQSNFSLIDGIYFPSPWICDGLWLGLTNRMQKNECYASLRLSLRESLQLHFHPLGMLLRGCHVREWPRPCGEEPCTTTHVNKVTLDLPALPNLQLNAAIDEIRRETAQLAHRIMKNNTCFKTKFWDSLLPSSRVRCNNMCS